MAAEELLPRKDAMLQWWRDKGLAQIREMVDAARADPKLVGVGRRGATALKAALLLGVGLFLIMRLSQVGWGAVFNALPETPWFYGLFALRYLALPISELAIYEAIWAQPLVRQLPVFLRKRVYNFAIVGYSGEGFLTLWARRNLDLPLSKILHGVKDNNLLSTFTSNLWTIIAIAALWASGGLSKTLAVLPAGAGALFALAFAIALVMAAGLAAFHRQLLNIPARRAPFFVGVHGARMAMVLVLHAAMYAAALPAAPISAWLVFITVYLVISRLPLIPNQDLVFLGAAVALTPLVGADDAAVAGMLLAEAGLMQATNAFLFFATASLARTAAQKPLTPFTEPRN